MGVHNRFSIAVKGWPQPKHFDFGNPKDGRLALSEDDALDDPSSAVALFGAPILHHYPHCGARRHIAASIQLHDFVWRHVHRLTPRKVECGVIDHLPDSGFAFAARTASTGSYSLLGDWGIRWLLDQPRADRAAAAE
jgi:hypothetical protein